jgi:PelA/Pel-15E family pectate lyase
MAFVLAVAMALACSIDLRQPARADEALDQAAQAAMRKAATYYREKVASHGGYVYYYSADLSQRWGEGAATPDQIFVQPPGTPTVGLAYLAAYKATGDTFYLDAAREAGAALIYGQLESGGWTQTVDFNPRGSKAAQYRSGKGRGKNNSTLDDGISQSAIQFLARLDQALEFKDQQVHEAVMFALKALLQAQFENGAFPQVWTGPVIKQPIVKATFPDYDWRTEGRIKEYWTQYTLNDGLAGTVAQTLIVALEVYQDPKYKAALVKLGDFLLLGQLPEPQSAWSQQYSYEMHPIWARKFEPPAVTGGESQDVLETLLKIYRATGDKKYLAPFPTALAYLKKSVLPDGRLARYYELRTNKPLYMTKDYQLTYSDADVPDHYGWKVDSRLEVIEQDYATAVSGGAAASSPLFPRGRGIGGEREQSHRPSDDDIREIIAGLDVQGRWLSTYAGERLVGQPKFKPGFQYLDSAVFSRNLQSLSAYISATKWP